MTTLRKSSSSNTTTADERCLPSILMIIDFGHSFKDYNKILDFYGIWNYTCPKCGAKHRFHRHARYPRYLTLWDEGALKEERLDILACSVTPVKVPIPSLPWT